MQDYNMKQAIFRELADILILVSNQVQCSGIRKFDKETVSDVCTCFVQSVSFCVNNYAWDSTLKAISTIALSSASPKFYLISSIKT